MVIAFRNTHAVVDWMQTMESQRSELRELNDVNLSRIDERFARVDERFARIDARFDQARAEWQAGLADLRLQVKTDIADLRQEMRTGFSKAETMLERRSAELMKWSFVFWVGSTVTLVIALASLGRLGR